MVRKLQHLVSCQELAQNIPPSTRIWAVVGRCLSVPTNDQPWIHQFLNPSTHPNLDLPRLTVVAALPHTWQLHQQLHQQRYQH